MPRQRRVTDCIKLKGRTVADDSSTDISVVGHTVVTGSDAYNSALSLKRAEIVRDALVGAGVPGEVIEIAYHGANNPLVPTPRGVPELRNRRVEVTIR